MRKLATMLRSRDDHARVKLLDAAYWIKGCSSLGRLRYAVILRIGTKKEGSPYCIMDLKEAAQAAAPRRPRVRMPADQAERVVKGARYLSPFLGKRMRPVKLLGKSVFVREPLPQDLKVEIEQLTREEAMKVAPIFGCRGWEGAQPPNRRLQLEYSGKRTFSATVQTPWTLRLGFGPASSSFSPITNALTLNIAGSMLWRSFERLNRPSSSPCLNPGACTRPGPCVVAACAAVP